MNERLPERLALALATVPLLAADPALASATTGIFGGQNPLAVFVEFMTGPFAYALVILAILAAGGSLVFGGDFSGYSRRFVLVAVAGAAVILADDLVRSLFGGGAGYSVPPDMLLQAWPWPDGAEAGR